MTLSIRSLDQLIASDLDGLRTLWSEMFAVPPPIGAKRELLLRLLAYAWQERTYGGLSRSVRKALEEAAYAHERKHRGVQAGDTTLRLGARLTRRWNGGTHEVTVLAQGFAYRGKHYRSLTEVAKTITGAHWSGPRFFGLKGSQRVLKKERA